MFSSPIGMMAYAIALTVCAIWFSNCYNRLVKLKAHVDEAFAVMDVHLEKRYDLIPNLVNTVKGSAAHEEETLTQVIEARNAAWSANSWTSRLQSENDITDALHGLFAVAENYPELQANKNFVKFQDQLIKIEDDIAHARTYYNGTVREYNTRIKQFPTIVYAKMLKFKHRPYFEVSNSEKRNNVNVEF